MKQITYTVHDAIESIGFGRFQIILSAVAGFSWMADSMEIMLLSLLSPALVCEWGISTYQQAIGTMCVFLGWTLSSPFWGWFCDRFGRKTGLWLSALLASLFGIATACAPSFPWFVVLRGVTGLAMGAMPQSATIYTEFLPVVYRAKGVLLLEVFFALGAAVEAMMALFIMPIWGWRGLVISSSLPLLMFSVCCVWLPESARYYVHRNEKAKARKVLENIAAWNGKSLMEGELVAEKNLEDNIKPPTVFALLDKHLRRTTILVWITWMLFGFSYYGMSLYTTKLFQSTDTCHGGNPANAGLDSKNGTVVCIPLKQDDYVDIIATSFSELPGLLLTCVLVDRIGRRFTMASQMLFFAIFNYILYFCLRRSIIVVILFCARGLIAGAFQTAYIYAPEVYPTPLRGLGLGTASGFGRFGAMVTPFVAQVIAEYNLVYATLIYGSTGVIGAVAAALLPIETAGRAMKDVHH